MNNINNDHKKQIVPKIYVSKNYDGFKPTGANAIEPYAFCTNNYILNGGNEEYVLSKQASTQIAGQCFIEQVNILV